MKPFVYRGPAHARSRALVQNCFSCSGICSGRGGGLKREGAEGGESIELSVIFSSFASHSQCGALDESFGLPPHAAGARQGERAELSRVCKDAQFQPLALGDNKINTDLAASGRGEEQGQSQSTV